MKYHAIFSLVVSLLLMTSCVWLHPVENEPTEKIFHDAKTETSVVDNIIEINKGTKLNLLEGDISIDEAPELVRTQYSGIKSNLLKRDLRRLQEYLWVDRVVPYEFTPQLENGREIIEEALREISSKVCLKFKERTDEKHWIRFVDEGGCFSGVGRTFWRTGSQKISLGSACLQKGTIVHEVLHSLGVWHEQSRPDRDKYVEIFWENIVKGEEHNFAKHSYEEAVSLQSPYDLTSIMHYGRLSFSKNGEPTIVAIGDKNKRLGQRERLSEEDVIQLNLLYKCKDVGKVYTSWNSWSPCNSEYGCKVSRQRFCSNYNGNKCPEANVYGIQTEYKKCIEQECYRPSDGHWNRWLAWTKCDKECGTGTKTRTRKCDDPAPKHGGKSCRGFSKMSSECYIVPCGLGPDDCQFDNQGMCFWEDESNRNYKWQRIKGKTPSGNTGPETDHSTGKGHYLYAESSAPASIGMKADLVSKVFPKTNALCLCFFYSMHGVNIGALRVFIHTEGTKYDEKIWENTGPQGAGWKEAKVVLRSSFAYKIKIQAERGSSFLGDIGLDDVQFKEGSCNNGVDSFTNPTVPMTTPAPTKSHVDPLTELCGIRVIPLGCFADLPQSPAMPYILDSHRGPGSEGYHGTQLSWTDYTGSLNSLFCDCLNQARSRGFKYVGMQYYGECWGVGSSPKYNRYGISTQCINGKYQPCYHENKKEVCMGKAQTNYVYELVGTIMQ